MGAAVSNCCCQDDQDKASNFTFMTRSLSLHRMSSDLQLNQQGMSADILNAVKRAELRNRAMPVTIADIWRSVELNSSLLSKKLKIVVLELFKQNEIVADETLTFFSTDHNIVQTSRSLECEEGMLFYTCRQLLDAKYPSYKFDPSHRIVPREQAQVLSLDQLKSFLLSSEAS